VEIADGPSLRRLFEEAMKSKAVPGLLGHVLVARGFPCLSISSVAEMHIGLSARLSKRTSEVPLAARAVIRRRRGQVSQ